MTIRDLYELAINDPIQARAWMENATVEDWREMHVMKSALGPVMPKPGTRDLLRLPPLPNILAAAS